VNTYFLKNIDEDSLYKTDKLENVMSLVWATDNKTVFYTKPEDKTLRQYRVYMHKLGTSVQSDSLLFEETDKTMEINISLSTSKQYLIFSVSKTKTSEAWYMPANGEMAHPQLFLKREPGIRYSINHLEGDEFVVYTNMDNAINGKIMLAKIKENKPAKWKTLIAHRDIVLLDGFSFTKDYLILSEKENAQDRVRVINRKTNESVYIDPGISNYSISYAFEDFDYEKTKDIELSCAGMQSGCTNDTIALKAVFGEQTSSHDPINNLHTQSLHLFVEGYFDVRAEYSEGIPIIIIISEHLLGFCISEFCTLKRAIDISNLDAHLFKIQKSIIAFFTQNIGGYSVAVFRIETAIIQIAGDSQHFFWRNSGAGISTCSVPMIYASSAATTSDHCSFFHHNHFCSLFGGIDCCVTASDTASEDQNIGSDDLLFAISNRVWPI
jgi:hypothetical protein